MAVIIDGQKKPTPGHLAGPEKRDSVAGKYHIRKYEERDYEMVRTFYIQGIQEHIPQALWYFLRSPRTHLALLAVFLLTYLSSASYLLSLAATSSFLVAGMFSMKNIWDVYLQHVLATDMMDIRRNYLEPKDCCFWVVDAGEEVVGTVAIMAPENPAWWGNARELTRMSVKKEHRGQGLSKELIKMVIRFSRERGYQEVMLGTSMVQRVAHRAYESMGFRKALETHPFFLAKLIMAVIIDGQKKPTPGHLAAGPEKRDSVAGKYHIRKYEERDYEMVRTFYIQGIQEHIPRALWYFLRSPRTHLALLAIFLLTYLSSASYLLSLAAMSSFLVAGMFSMKNFWDDYLQHVLATDMMDIRRTYLEPKDCCFWVVDAGEEVVGTVAVMAPENPTWWGNARELTRMSVKKEHRGQGLSKELIKTVIRFSRERGYQEVVLGTSTIQHVAHRAYESMGFRKALQIHPFLVAKLIGFSVYWYCYKIPNTH